LLLTGRKGFTADEIVDSGWASRRDATIRDRFRRRLMVPVRDGQDRLIGGYGRDVTDRANQKYLNTAETVTFHKRSAVYRPVVDVALDPHATVVVCEGSLDALAIAATAASAGASAHFAPVSPSGTALTVEHARTVLSVSAKPPLVCADGDSAGLSASRKWVETFMSQARETIVTVLPDGHDPASWLRQEGVDGLRAFVRKGCLERTDTEIRPVPAGWLLAREAMSAALAGESVDPFTVLPRVMGRLAAQASLVPSPAAVERFAVAAGHALAEFGVGTESGLSGSLLRAVESRVAVSQPHNREVVGARPSDAVLGL
jgi:DNA primase